tara:strand:- start:1696 stop:2238 length:543 start_codon:yes stop_codon:yes gene_type:complete
MTTLPNLYPISGIEESFKSIQSKLSKGTYSIFQYRKKEREVFDKLEAENIKNFCKKNKILFILNSFHLDESIEPDGYHLTSADLYRFSGRPFSPKKIVGASCHNQKDIKQANKLEADYIFISPIKSVEKYTNVSALGWIQFSKLAKFSKSPCYALGGLSHKDLENALQHNAVGVAGISRI